MTSTRRTWFGNLPELSQDAAVTLGLFIVVAVGVIFFLWRVRVQNRRKRARSRLKRVVVKATPKQIKKLIAAGDDKEQRNKVGTDIIMGESARRGANRLQHVEDRNRKKRERKDRKKNRR
jgi:Flp pilus assembly protein TadB